MHPTSNPVPVRRNSVLPAAPLDWLEMHSVPVIGYGAEITVTLSG